MIRRDPSVGPPWRPKQNGGPAAKDASGVFFGGCSAAGQGHGKMSEWPLCPSALSPFGPCLREGSRGMRLASPPPSLCVCPRLPLSVSLLPVPKAAPASHEVIPPAAGVMGGGVQCTCTSVAQVLESGMSFIREVLAGVGIVLPQDLEFGPTRAQSGR